MQLSTRISTFPSVVQSHNEISTSVGLLNTNKKITHAYYIIFHFHPKRGNSIWKIVLLLIKRNEAKLVGSVILV